MTRTAIIGAGPMGLTTAYLLAEKGHQTVIFEADDRPGGMSASFDFEGVLIERYYHYINKPDHHLLALLKKIGLEDELIWHDTKMGYAKPGADGHPQIHPWSTPWSLLKFPGAPLVSKLRYGFHAFTCKFLKDLSDLDDQSARDWINRWEGSQGYDIFWRSLFEKKFFELADPLSAAWIASRIRRMANSRESLLRESLGYLEGGSQSLLDKLWAETKARGGEMHLATPVEKIEIAPGKSGGQVVTAQGREYFEKIVSTIPLPYLPQLIPGLPGEYKARVGQIKNVGCVCVLFRLGQPVSRNFWLNVDMPGWDVPGVIEYSNLRPMAKAHVYLPFYMPQSHPNWRINEQTIIEKARSYLKELNPKAAATEEAAMAFRYEYSQPVCPPGFRKILPPYETGHPGLLAADTTHSFPEDRSINESVRIAGELAQC